MARFVAFRDIYGNHEVLVNADLVTMLRPNPNDALSSSTIAFSESHQIAVKGDMQTVRKALEEAVRNEG